jgi:RNA polymerase subunit RPABC4/transcription elongation factor Spt4
MVKESVMAQSKSSGALILLVILILVIVLILPMFGFGLGHIFGIGPLSVRIPFEGFHGGPPLMLIPILAITVFWILIAAWVYNDAERNGMSGILWALLVFFGNFIALIIYLIVRSGANSSNPMTVPSSKACPNCKGAIQADFVICPNCGTSLKNTCPKCEKNVQSGWQHCPYCGENL